MDMPLNAAVEGSAGDVGLDRYDRLAMALHWLTVVLVLLLFGLGELWDFAPRGPRRTMISLHTAFGILLAVVLTVRIVWRLTPGHRVRDVVTGVVALASKTVHLVLYCLLAAEVVLGFLFRWSTGRALGFFGVPIPSPIGPLSRYAHYVIGESHKLVAWAIIALAAAHACAALFHHFIKRDDVLRQMLPPRLAGGPVSTQE